MEIKRGTPSPILVVVVLVSLLTSESYGDLSSPSLHNEITVGVILDMRSWTGKTILSSIRMAISDFYATNNHYKTRIVLHIRDSKADPMRAMSAGIDLMENIKVQAIIGPERTIETKFLAVLGEKAEVPIFSFSSILSASGEYPFLVQIKQDETVQFKGIATILNSYGWRSIIIIYEDSDDGREFLPPLVESLQKGNVHTASKTAISPLSTDDQIHDELRKLKTLQPTIYIVHMSPSLAARLFSIAKRLEMVKEGYSWIVTDKIMNQFNSLDSEDVESMQGVLGLKAYIPSSSKLRNVTLRWRREFYGYNDPSMEFRDLDVSGIWAYDTLWALAESIERVSVECFQHATDHSSLDVVYVANSCSGTRLLGEIRRNRFEGLSGEFQILEGKLHSEAFVIVNVIGKGERRVGFWTLKDGIVKEMQELVKGRSLYLSTSRRGLEDVIWPGGSAVAPKGWSSLTSGKPLRIGVVNLTRFSELLKVVRDPQTGKLHLTGFCIEVFRAAINTLDYPVPYEFVPYGENMGTYNDLIDQVYYQKYDGCIGDITILANRSLYVDFTVPFTEAGVGIVTKREKSDMWMFLKPLYPSLWLTSAGFFVLTGLVVWAIEHPTNEEFQGSVAHQIGTILWFGFSTIVYAHRERLTRNLSRFVVIVWLFVVLILSSSYAATLSSRLTLKNIQLGSAGEYIGIQGGSFLRGLIYNNLNFKDNRLQRYISREEYADALSRGSKKGGVAAIIDEIPYIKLFLAEYGADYTMIASRSITSGFGFAFTKGSSLVRDLSIAIMKLRETWQLETIEKAWFKKYSSYVPQEDDAIATPNILNLESFGGLFLVSFLSSVSALLIHIISILLKKLAVKNIIINLIDGGKLDFILRYIAPINGHGIELINVR